MLFSLKWLLGVLMLLSAFSIRAESKPELDVVISLDIPPYVMLGARRGMEVDVVREALPEYQLRLYQRPYGDLQQAISEQRADIAVGVRALDDQVFYSDNFITFTNVAISRVSDDLKVDTIGELHGHRVLTWQGAWRVLGDTFRSLFGPEGMDRSDYVEVADQAEQVRLFWNGSGDLVVIDLNIFRHFSQAFGHDLAAVRIHRIFPPVTNYRVGFADAEVRNRFNAGLLSLCKSGRYAELMKQYQIDAASRVCQP